MANKIKGLTIEIGGETTALNKALGEVNKHSRDLKSELRDVERLLKLDPSDTTLLAQKQKILAENIENTSKKLETLKEAEKQAQEQFKQGKIGEDQYRAIQREVIKAEEELKKMNKQLKEMDWKSVADGLDKFGKKSTEVGKTLTATVTAPILGVGVASFKMAADLEDAFGATDQVFKGSAEEVKKWADELESYYGIAESEALEYANTMGAMLQNIGGLTEEEAAKQSATLIELAGDLTAMFGGTTESAIQALTGALKGNNSMLDNYGMGVNDATIKTKALEMGLYDGTGQMDLASKQAATLALIMEQTADAQGQAAREADGASGTLRGLGAELKNIATDIGEVLLPIITPFIEKLKEIVAGFGELSPETQKTIVIIAGLVAAIGPLIFITGTLSSKLADIIRLFAPMMTGLAGTTAATGGLSAVIGALTGPIGIAIAAIAAITAVIITLWKTNEDFRENVKKIWEQIKEIFNTALNGIKEIVNTIYNAVLKFWNDNSEKIKDITQKIWDAISKIFNTVLLIISGVITTFINAVTSFWTKFGDDIKAVTKTAWNLIKSIIETVINIIQGIINTFIALVTGDWEGFTEGLKNLWSSMWDGIKKIVEGAWTLLSTAFALVYEGISSWFTGLIEDALEWGKNLVEGLWNGISSMADWVKEKVQGFVEGIGNTIKDFFGIASPSKLMAEYGKNIDEGLAEGVLENEHMPLNAITSVGKMMASAAIDAVETVMDLLTIDASGITISGSGGRVAVSRGNSKAQSQRKKDMAKFRDEIYAVANSNKVDISTGYEMWKSNQRDNIYGRPETYSSSKSSGITQNITVNSPKTLTPSEIARETAKAATKLVLPLLR